MSRDGASSLGLQGREPVRVKLSEGHAAFLPGEEEGQGTGCFLLFILQPLQELATRAQLNVVFNKKQCVCQRGKLRFDFPSEHTRYSHKRLCKAAEGDLADSFFCYIGKNIYSFSEEIYICVSVFCTRFHFLRGPRNVFNGKARGSLRGAAAQTCRPLLARQPGNGPYRRGPSRCSKPRKNNFL